MYQLSVKKNKIYNVWSNINKGKNYEQYICE